MECELGKLKPRWLRCAIQESVRMRLCALLISNSAGTDDMMIVMEELVDVNKNWKELGIALGLREPTLDGIEANYHDVEKCKMGMLSKWLRWVDGCEPSWKVLADALRKPTVNHAPIAKAIEKKYLAPSIN